MSSLPQSLRRAATGLAVGLAFLVFPGSTMAANTDSRPIAVALHGGAGTISQENMTPEREARYRATLLRALEEGYAILAGGGSSLDAVESAISLMEDSELFNAGKGAVFTSDGRNEMDASIMDGGTLQAGAVAAVTRIRNPIRAARLVMEKSVHVMLAGKGAEDFAAEQNMELVEPSYFYTERRWNALQRAREKEQEGEADEAAKHGTVGVVALDRAGNLAAGTSTGGMTNKKYGRIGDSPIIGAGTYANNRSAAISGTGHGEYFIRATVARDIASLIEYKGLSAQEAADEVIHEKLLGGTGGVIVLDARGNVAFSFNTEGMYRGVLKEGGEPRISIYKD